MDSRKFFTLESLITTGITLGTYNLLNERYSEALTNFVLVLVLVVVGLVREAAKARRTN